MNVSGSAIGVLNGSGDAALTIQLEDDNTIENVSMGIYVYSYSAGTATLNITGNGSLNASGSQTGIMVQSNSGDATLTIRNAKVEAMGTSTVSYGVNVRSNSSSTASLTVDGGSLTASGSTGILYDSSGGDSAPNAVNLTISNSALVDARDGKIGAGSATNLQPVPPSGNGIVFNDNQGTVYGDVTLQEDLTIGEGESLNIPGGAGLEIPGGKTLTNAGTVTNSGTLTNNGTINNSGTLPSNIAGNPPPSITTTALADGTVGTAYSATLAASGNPTSWNITGSLPAGLALNGSTGVLSGTPTADGIFNFTVKATNGGGSDSEEFTLTISQAATIHVTGVSLNKSETTLTVGGTETLTATITPDNATNKAVMWSSDNESVATVTNGVVTAVGAGTATIISTTQDGGKTATCVVTVTAQTYNISATPALLNFGAVTGGYAAAPAAQTVTITNTGNQSVTVNLPTSTNYTIAAGTGFTGGTAALAPNAAAEFTVRPKTGLGAGKYGETLTISGSGGASAKVTLSFAVNAAGTPGAGQGGPKQNPPTGVGLPMPPDGSGGHAGQGAGLALLAPLGAAALFAAAARRHKKAKQAPGLTGRQ